MFWTFLLIAALGVLLVRLGAYSVWVAVLSAALKVMLLVLTGLASVFMWRRLFRKREAGQPDDPPS